MKNNRFSRRRCPDKHTQAITILYLFCLVGMLSISALIFFTRTAPVNRAYISKYLDISNEWSLDSSGESPVTLTDLGSYMDEEKGVLSIYYQLPELRKDTSLIYRSKDVSTTVYIEGKVIYKTSVYESNWYNASPGNLWNIATIHADDSEKRMELQIRMAYDKNAITVDSLMLGDKSDIILNLLYNNLFDIITSLLLILIGVVLIILNFLPSYGQARTDHSLFWLGLFALMTGVWCLIETNMLQFCVRDMRKLQLIDNMLMIVDSMPLLLYMNCEHNIFKYRSMRILSYANIGYILACVFLHITNLRDIHYMLNGAVLLMIITDVSLFIWVLARLIRRIKEKKPILSSVLQALGVSSLWVLAILEAIRSIHADRIDRAGLIRIGMLLLCLFWSASSQIKTYKLVIQGLKYDLVSKLAYSDGLTGVGNRTAFIEKLDEYVQKAETSTIRKLGIVYFDVNNLKKVNDTQGHEIGDKLIQVAAMVINQSFGTFGECYRIGGDEFAVLMEGKEPESDYKKGHELFEQQLTEQNRDGNYPFDIRIAHGFSICDELTHEKIDEAISTADNRMYEDKILMKKDC